jgi:DNA-binding transcriptional regulator YhcF (GntR family)
LNKKEITKIEDIIFETKIFKKLVLKLNSRFYEELEKVEILEKILKKNNLVSDLKEKYFSFLLELKKYENSETTKEKVKEKLENFLKNFLEYKQELKKI